MKRILLFIAVAFISVVSVAIILVAKNRNENCEWPHRYATTIVRGHVSGLPESSKNDGLLGLWDVQPETWVNSADGFCFTLNMYSPLYIGANICGVWYPLLLCPGDTVDIEVNYPKLMTLKDNPEKLYSEAFKMRGAYFQLSSKYRMHVDDMCLWADAIDFKYLKAHPHMGLSEYSDWQWKKHLNRLAKIDSLELVDTEKKHLQLRLEQKYIDHVCDYARELKEKPTDSHAQFLLMPKTLLAACYFDVTYLDYLKVNRQDEKPMGHYLKDREKGEDVIARIKASQEVSDDEINSLSPELCQAACKIKDHIIERTKGLQQWKPNGEPATWLDQIVSRHRGKVVYVDFWATWCGACLMGIKDMATVKDEFENRGVYYVYITDNTSKFDGYEDLKKKYSGDHFLFTKNDLKAMNIPGYNGAIPHYLIYGRDGQLIKTITGWSGLEDMTQELNNVLKK